MQRWCRLTYVLFTDNWLNSVIRDRFLACAGMSTSFTNPVPHREFCSPVSKFHQIDFSYRTEYASLEPPPSTLVVSSYPMRLIYTTACYLSTTALSSFPHSEPSPSSHSWTRENLISTIHRTGGTARTAFSAPARRFYRSWEHGNQGFCMVSDANVGSFYERNTEADTISKQL